jgi:hypothetical protein
MIDAIDQKEITWKKTNLPAGYMEGKHKALSLVQKLVKELLKYEKQNLTKYVSCSFLLRNNKTSKDIKHLRNTIT